MTVILTVAAMLLELLVLCELDPPQALKDAIWQSANPKLTAFALLMVLTSPSIGRLTSRDCSPASLD
jgi:hypothetical protein